MLKGINKRVVEVVDIENEYFEKAILFLRAGRPDSDEGLLRQRAGEYVRAIKYRPPGVLLAEGAGHPPGRGGAAGGGADHRRDAVGGGLRRPGQKSDRFPLLLRGDLWYTMGVSTRSASWLFPQGAAFVSRKTLGIACGFPAVRPWGRIPAKG